MDTTVGELLKDKRAVEVLEEYVPGISTNPMIGTATDMTIKALLAMPQAQQYGVTEEKARAVLDEINDRT
jgi:hypothetical protein